MAFTRDNNQQIASSLGFTGQAGGGAVDAWLAQNPQLVGQYTAMRQQYDPSYQTAGTTQPYNGGVSPVGVVEPFNQYQKDAITRLAQGAPAMGFMQNAQGNIQNANTQYGQGAQGMDAQDFNAGIQRYLNPYTQDVVNNSVNQVQQQSDMLRNRIKEQMAQAGSFGSTAQGVENSQLNKDTLNQIGSLAGNLNYQGFTDAANNTNNQFNADRNRNLQAGQGYQSLAGTNFAGNTQNQQNFSNNINNLYGAGSAIQNQNQNLLNATQGQIAARQGFPYSQLQQIGGLTSPFNSTQSQGAYAGTPNAASSLGGLGMIGSSYLSQNYTPWGAQWS